ncbi:DUF2950 domain-containing protein [Mesorhizobium sp. 1B3]|uniref:DUF2950 domain-containing protein n=1 Tax=Mesorhizobium sp. 1B3 TaxID=3243599 RepID=UPI003D9663B1
MTTTVQNKFLRSACIAALLAASTVFGSVSAVAQEETAAEGVAAFAASEEPPVFDTADAAVDALKSALVADDFAGVAKLLGLDAEKARDSDGAMETFAEIREGAAKQVVVQELDDRRILRIGDRLWPLPFPIVRGDDGKWSFDTYAGLEEIVNRRVGENELEAIATMRAYVDAQQDYAEADRDGDGVLEFAQKLISSEGMTDGLYWPSDEINGESPAGDLSQTELADAEKGEGYFGYRFKILNGQGDNIAGGAYDYVINGNMIGGFALVAWPVKYAETGVKIFAVNQHGIVYEADLGPATEQIVKYIDRFNPDESWSVVAD